MLKSIQNLNSSSYRGNNSFKKEDNKKKFNFKKGKDNICESLNEVELFLNNIKGISKYLKLYKLLK